MRTNTKLLLKVASELQQDLILTKNTGTVDFRNNGTPSVHLTLFGDNYTNFSIDFYDFYTKEQIQDKLEKTLVITKVFKKLGYEAAVLLQGQL